MIKLQALLLALSAVISEVNKTLPMIPSRFLKMKGLKSVVFIFNDRCPLCVKCEEPNGINARIQCFNDLLKAHDLLREYGDSPVSVTLMFNENRGNLQDTYYL